MHEYNFLTDISRGWLDLRVSAVTVKLCGVRTDRLTPQQKITPMGWEGVGLFVNKADVVFKYEKRVHPNSKWPWPFRNFTQPTVVVEGTELYDRHGTLLFRFVHDHEGLPYYLRPGDTFHYDVGRIKVTI
jgi:hypothetical protein